MGTNNLGKKLRCKNLEKSVAEGSNSMQRNISELLEGKAKKNTSTHAESSKGGRIEMVG